METCTLITDRYLDMNTDPLLCIYNFLDLGQPSSGGSTNASAYIWKFEDKASYKCEQWAEMWETVLRVSMIAKLRILSSVLVRKARRYWQLWRGNATSNDRNYSNTVEYGDKSRREWCADTQEWHLGNDSWPAGHNKEDNSICMVVWNT